MPTPEKGEKKEDFIDRCIPVVINDGTAKDGAQATTICNSIWDESKRTSEDAMYVKSDEMERRCLPTSELRVGIENDKPKIVGYAAVFNTWADIGGWFRESIRPGAFAKTIRENDIRALMNHDPNYVLGRNKAKTLSLREDDKGLAVEIDPVGATWANDLMASMKRGDVSQMSFGFNVNKQEVDYDKDERVLVDVTLFDVSVVTYPAYPTTTAQVRSAFMAKRTDTTSSTLLSSSVSTTGELPLTNIGTITVGSGIVSAGPLLKELEPIIRKLARNEELTEAEWRVVAAHYPDLSVPPAKHTETEPPPPAKHAGSDTRSDRWTELFIRAERIAPSTTR